MDDEIIIISKEYIKQVNFVCNILLTGLNLKSKQDFWDYQGEHHVLEFDINGYHFNLHGRGCKVKNENFYLDWDFGFGSRWCGLNPWLLAMTLEENNYKNLKYYDGDKINSEFKQLVINGDMFKKGNLFYLVNKNEFFTPTFPVLFDTLIIEFDNFEKKINRNKIVDRFLRKSNKVSYNIEKSSSYVMLKFIFKGEEIYSLPYDSESFPEKAVKIMNELIAL